MYRILSFAIYPLIIIGFLTACGDGKELNEHVAITEIRHHLEMNPIYESAGMDFGEVRLRRNADASLLRAYQEIQQDGYITFGLMDKRKRFLSKDSTFTYLVELTDKAIPFVLEKKEKKVTVKTFYYELDESAGIHLEQTGKNKAKAIVTLKKRATDFAAFAEKAKDSHASFTKKEYTLRFNKNAGWQVSN